MVGGEKIPEIAMMKLYPARRGWEKREVTVTVWVAKSPLQVIVALMMFEVSPMQERVTLIGKV